MCGIIGIGSKQSVQASERMWLGKGLIALHHRGPDDSGEWWSPDYKIGFGHRRLSIIDLSPGGHQPMHHLSEGLHLVFNGEIYNYQSLKQRLYKLGHNFTTNSDTEVILAAYKEWNTDCLAELKGMFAFALFDDAQQTLFIARDRAGEKPLFYYHYNDQLLFSSELKGLFANPNLPRKVDPLGMDCYLSMGYVPGDKCILKGFNKLPPAHALVFNTVNGELKKWQYWAIPNLSQEVDNSDKLGLVEELESLLEQSVKEQLVADVPVGVLLSGGVDSSLVTAMAVRAASNVKTFTVTFPGHEKYDESAHAKLVANYFETDHHQLESAEVDADLLPVLARQFDEPLIDSSMIPTYLVSKLIRQYCTVALGGDGGDELFGGYGHHNQLMWMDAKFGNLPQILRHTVSLVGHSLPTGFKGKVWMQNFDADLKKGLPLIASYFDARTRRHLLDGVKPRWSNNAEQIRSALIPKEKELLQRVTKMDFLTYLPEDILVKVDRASMLNSLEIRAPFLDKDIIEFAYGKVPASLKANVKERKILLKQLSAKVLPDSFDKERKQGFGIPLGTWLKSGKWHQIMNDTLLNPNSIFSSDVVVRLIKGQMNGRNNTERIFGLLMFELWRKEYNISL